MKKLLVAGCIIFVFSFSSTAQVQEESTYVDSVKNVEVKMANLLDSLQRQTKRCVEYLSQKHGTDKYSLISLQPMLYENTLLSMELNILVEKRFSLLKKLHKERSDIFLRSLNDEKNWKTYKVMPPRKQEIYN